MTGGVPTHTSVCLRIGRQLSSVGVRRAHRFLGDPACSSCKPLLHVQLIGLPWLRVSRQNTELEWVELLMDREGNSPITWDGCMGRAWPVARGGAVAAGAAQRARRPAAGQGRAARQRGVLSGVLQLGRQCETEGINGYISKPVKLEELHAALLRWLIWSRTGQPAVRSAEQGMGLPAVPGAVPTFN